MDVTGRSDERSVLVHRPFVPARGRRVVVGVGEATADSRTAVHVEHRIGRAVPDVHPDRARRLEGAAEVGVGRNVVDVVGDPDRVGHRRLVVHHVVERPHVAPADEVAVRVRRLHDRLLLAGPGEALAADPRRGEVLAREVQEHAVVEVHDVGRRRYPARIDHVRLEADDVAVVG